MNRSRYWVHLAFWAACLLSLALQLLDAQTRGGVTDGDGSNRHLIAMALLLLPLARVVYRRAADIGLSWWMSLLAVPASVMLFPWIFLALGLVRTPESRAADTPAISLWWALPALVAGAALGAFASVILR